MCFPLQIALKRVLISLPHFLNCDVIKRYPLYTSDFLCAIERIHLRFPVTHTQALSFIIMFLLSLDISRTWNKLLIAELDDTIVVLGQNEMMV